MIIFKSLLANLKYALFLEATGTDQKLARA